MTPYLAFLFHYVRIMANPITFTFRLENLGNTSADGHLGIHGSLL